MRPISSQEFFDLRDKLNAECEEVMRGKNPVYTIGSDNYVQNFQSIAQRLGVRASFVALVYLHKHFDAIVAHVVKGEVKDVEAIDSRFADARNYLDILYALVKAEALPSASYQYFHEADIFPNRFKDDAIDAYDITGGPI